MAAPVLEESEGRAGLRAVEVRRVELACVMCWIEGGGGFSSSGGGGGGVWCMGCGEGIGEERGGRVAAVVVVCGVVVV